MTRGGEASTSAHPSCAASRCSRSDSNSFLSVARRAHRRSLGTPALVAPTVVVLVEIRAAGFVQESLRCTVPDTQPTWTRGNSERP